jgi:hypothetical protein
LKKTLAIVTVSLMAFIFFTSYSHADDKGQVTVVWNESSKGTSISDNLVWSRVSKYAAIRAITFLKAELNKEIKLLANAGAVAVSKKYVDTSPSVYTDWKKFVPVFQQFVLVGKDKSGKVVGKSEPIPKNTQDLAAMLVQLNADVCNIAGRPPVNNNLPSCSINPVDESKFLRASLRSWIENYSDFEMEESKYLKDLLATCLGNNFKYSLKSGAVRCPDNSKIWAENKDIPLTQNYSKFKYKIVIDAKSRTAVMTYLNRKIIDKAPEAKNTNGSMLMFSY